MSRRLCPTFPNGSGILRYQNSGSWAIRASSPTEESRTSAKALRIRLRSRSRANTSYRNPADRKSGKRWPISFVRSGSRNASSRAPIDYSQNPMSKPTRTKPPRSAGNALPATRRKAFPHRFVLDAVAEMAPWTRAMFGALAVYVGEKIVFLLRDRPGDPGANGVWLAISNEYQESLSADFPNARPVRIMGKEINGWRLLPVDAVDFEESSLHACELVVRRDPRIGKVPNSKRTPASKR